MPRTRLPLRLVLFAALALGAALLLGLVVMTLNGVLEFYQRLVDLPLWLRIPLLVAAVAFAGAFGWLLWRLARPARHPAAAPAAPPVSRAEVDTRIARLRERAVETAALEAELVELDRRRASGELYVALFGEISTGKSSLIRALAPDAAPAIDVRGGTTRHVAHHRGRLADGRELVLADVPGTAEVDGVVHEQLARDEALRAHAVVYLAASDLTRAQDVELRWLAGFGKPLVLALNKADLYDDAQRAALLDRFRARYAAHARAIVAISAGGSERYERMLADGRREKVERERAADVAPLLEVLAAIVARGTDALEPAREAAVLAEVGRRGDALAREAAERESA
ncbi:GTPase, partial [Dokdonella sp.]|uniref:GTPase n=1 Tax=Dokdonella sp. TaxID=2291710 RepID=UPI002F3F302D